MATKHIFAGTTRLVSKMGKQDKPGANPHGHTPVEKDLYYFHPDHLGSSSYITDAEGKLYEHLQYFPFGETWVQEASNRQRTPYLFTGKELDEETQLYYFGARYYDARTSVWQSADPILARYVAGEVNGGVYSPINLGLYSYSFNNPINLYDPDGKATTGEIIDSAAEGCGAASCAGFAVARAAWDVLGAESVSKVFDHHVLGERSDMTGSDYGWAAVNVGVVAGAAKLAGVITNAGAKIVGSAQPTRTLGHKAVSTLLAYAHALNPKVTKVTMDLGYKKLLDGVKAMRGKNGPRPDVGVLYENGNVKAIEVMSKTDKKADLLQRNRDKMKLEGIGGTVEVNNWAVKLHKWFGGD